MPLTLQHHLYTLDTSSFYTDAELSLDIKLNHARGILAKIKDRLETDETYSREAYEREAKVLNRIITTTKELLKEQIAANVGIVRKVREEKLTGKAVISIFDSELARSLAMIPNELTEELIVVKVYYFQIMESIIHNGFTLRGEKYVFFSASAGQVRCKKFVAIRESSLKKAWGRLTCGLTVERINEMGGINTNKYLVYLALCNSATDVWEDFDIDRAIVVDDLEFPLTGEVDFIDNATFDISRQTMELPFNQTDGAGMINYGTDNFMVRGPWLKGLLTPFPFRKFLAEKGGNPVIKDIWGAEHNVEVENIQIIFTKSQLKMWKFYKSWDEYKAGYKANGCSMGVCNQESEFLDTVVSYQMLQTLTDVTDAELQYLTKATRNRIVRLATDVDTQLRVFGAHKQCSNKNPFQEALSIYPELLRDKYTKETLRNIKVKLEKEAWAGKLSVFGKYTFIIPDMYAFCEKLFLGVERPQGLLGDGEVYCSLFKGVERVACLRSPHLYREWGTRDNVAKEKPELGEWFVTRGVYVSAHDMLSRLLQMDYDGDKSLVIGDKKIVDMADRNMQGIVPLFYHMGTAKATEINNYNLYAGMTLAFTEGNIGAPSNEITKIWNREGEIDLDAIKIQCAIVNYTIDAAKTLFKPELPPAIAKKMKAHYGRKLPYFFQFAKDKTRKQVEEPVSRLVDQIRYLIPKTRMQIKYTTLGRFDYRKLTSGQPVVEDELYEQVTTKWRELTRNIRRSMKEIDDKNNFSYLFQTIRDEIFLFPASDDDIVDIIVHFLFYKKKSLFKYAFWQCLGEYALKNIKSHLNDGSDYCPRCGRRFKPRTVAQKFCSTVCKKKEWRHDIPLVCVSCHKPIDNHNGTGGKIRCDACQLEEMNARRRVENRR